jgi:hypothetical protein
LESGIVAGQFGGSFFREIVLKVARSSQHPAHGAPVREPGNQPLHDDLLPLHIKGNLSAGLE